MSGAAEVGLWLLLGDAVVTGALLLRRAEMRRQRRLEAERRYPLARHTLNRRKP